jgi:photosystem II stability/assembly factor-like uncharacterized protein
MSAWIQRVVLLLLLSSGSYLLAQPVARVSAAAPHPYIQQMVDDVSIDSLRNGVRVLASFSSRYEFGPDREAAADWMVHRMGRWGIEADPDRYTFPIASFNDVTMVGPNWAWIAGDNSLLMRTSDGGRHWEALTQGVPPEIDFMGISFDDLNQGWAVGNDGAILSTNNGGATWTRHDSATLHSLNDIGFTTYQLGIAVGGSGAIIRTTDGGTTWAASSSGVEYGLTQLSIVDSLNVWVSGGAGTLLRSTDKGVSWQLQTTGVTNTLNSVYFLDKNLGWSAGTNMLLKTTDGGMHWTRQPLPQGPLQSLDLRDVCFADSLSGWIVNREGGVLRTTDGGAQWSTVDALGRYGRLPLGRIGQSGGRYLIACGQAGDITTSTDGGQSWTRQTLGLPPAQLHNSRNIRVTLPGMVTPEKEVVLLAHYDSVKDSPGADDNASGVSAVLEAVRIMTAYKFEFTVTLLLVSAGEAFSAGSSEYAIQARAENRDIVAVLNADMISFPVTSDTTRLVVSSFAARSRLVDSTAVYNQRYGIGANIVATADSIGEGDNAIFGMVGYDNLNVSDATRGELLAGLHPYRHTPADTDDKLHPDLMRRAAQLMIATVAEVARPYVGPPLTWTWQKPFPQWNHLRSVKAVNANTLFAVGELGTIVKTTDGGRTWNRLVGETVNNLRGTWFANENIGFAVGDNGIILRTTNGGSSWTTQVIDPSIMFYGVCFSDAKTGTAVGYPSAIYRTTNGGNSWFSQLSGPAATLMAVSFNDANIGTIVGSSGTILRTTNGGAKWSRQLSGFEETDTLLLGVSFVNSNVGTVVGRSGTILHTTNGGATWILQNSGTAYHLNAVAFADASNGTAVGDAGMVLCTTDGGTTWTSPSDGVTEWFTGVSFSSPATGTAVGSYGTIFRTTDGGTSWTLQTQGPRTSLYGVWVNSATTATVVGYKGAIFRTTDAGATWVTQASGVKQTLWGIAYADANIAVAAGEEGTIIRTTDAGAHWTTVRKGSINEWLYGVSFASSSVGLVVGNSGIHRTINAGKTWTRIGSDPEEPPLKPLFAVSFANKNIATVVGDSGCVARSTDGGMTWKQRIPRLTDYQFNGVSSISSSFAIIVGNYGMIYRTNDGGSTWLTKQSGTGLRLNNVQFINDMYGIAVGDSGVMIRSTDRGLTWSSLASGSTNNLTSVHFSNAYIGAVVGEKGTILRTTQTDVPVSVPEERELSIPREFALYQNYPNPFNPSTAVSYQLLANSFVTLKVFDVLGREVATLVDGPQRAGKHIVRWDASRFTSGVYFYRLATDTFVETKKMILLK